MTPDQIEQLRSGAMQLGITLSSDQLTAFDKFARLLEEWNEKINLTSIPPEQFVSLHFLDSLSLAKAVNIPACKKIADIGTGAGFPGIPIAISFPEISVTLVEATQKKVNFMRTVCEALELKNITLENGRAEDCAQSETLRETFDLVTARAVAPMVILAEWLLPFVKINGYAVALKSEKVEQELGEAQEIITRLGGIAPKLTNVEIPGIEIQRKLISIKKVKPTPKKYPRHGLKRAKS